jgi:hypothetical protein
MYDLCDRFIKPATADIGGKGSGAFVELIQDGMDCQGRPWCGKPTHMVSYSWSYNYTLLLEVLEEFVEDRPIQGERRRSVAPSSTNKQESEGGGTAGGTGGGGCHYFFIDQFALDEHDFGKGKSQAEVITLYTVHCTHTLYTTLHSYTVHCTLYTLYSYTIHCTHTLYTTFIHCTLYTIHCTHTLYTVHFILYTIHCTLYTRCKI